MTPFDHVYNGFQVSGFKPTFVPNPSCCSDPTVLCANCAQEALSGFVSNARGDDNLEPLIPPEFEWGGESPLGIHAPTLIINTADDDEIEDLIPPEIVWTKLP